MEEIEKERNQFRLVAHDLNNILLSTLHSVTLLKQKIEEGSSEFSLIKIIESNSNRASDILNDILSQSDNDKLSNRFVDLSRLLNEVIIAFTPTLPREISIKTDIESHVDKVYCSRNDMYRVIMNLLINAKEAISNSGTISATLKNFVPNNFTNEGVGATKFAELKINDSGIGIDPDMLDKIFESNYSTKEKNRISGLGLNIVKDLVENIGGKIFVKSELKEGTEFSVLIPTMETITSSRVDGKQKTILIAEDDLTLLKLLSELLESYNYKVIKSLDGDDVLEKIKDEKNIDLIIIDKKMPKLDGIDCIKTIRGSGNQIPIILSSGSKSTISDSIIDNLKIEKVLNKPYDFEQMLSLIEGLIN